MSRCRKCVVCESNGVSRKRFGNYSRTHEWRHAEFRGVPLPDLLPALEPAPEAARIAVPDNPSWRAAPAPSASLWAQIRRLAVAFIAAFAQGFILRPSRA